MVDEGVLAQLRELGHPDARWLASGMEADVYVLDARTVARLPRAADPTEGRVDALLAAADLPFAVPRTTGHLDLPDGRRAALQPFLHGRSIGERYDEASGVLDPRAERSLLEVLTGLHDVSTGRLLGLAQPGVMGGRPAPPGTAWNAALREVLLDRVGRSEALLRAHVERLDDLVRAVTEFLDTRGGAPLVLQHGDLCRENVLVDDDGRLTAVLDWGFLTMLADPALELSLTAGFFDMYGPHALATDRRLSDAFTQACGARYGVHRSDLLRYRALYALLGANAYCDGVDGHFRWCVGQLGREDVRAAVLG